MVVNYVLEYLVNDFMHIQVFNFENFESNLVIPVDHVQMVDQQQVSVRELTL